MLVAVGMFLLVLWRLFDLFFGHHEDDGADLWKHRASDLLKAVLYGAICWSAISVLMHSGGGGSGAKDFSSTILGLPGGQLWLTLIGLGIIAYGGNQIYLAWNEKHQKKLATEGKSGEAGKAYLLFGKIGYVAKGIAVGLVGGLFVLRRVHPGPGEVRQHRQGPAQGAAAAVRPVVADRPVDRDRLLRPVPVRPGPAPVEASRGPRPCPGCKAGRHDDP